MVSLQGKRETAMTKSRNSDRNDQPVRLLDDAALDAVVGGMRLNKFAPWGKLPAPTAPAPAPY
ncbi:hypothetical protein [Bradyrhizobium sp. AUGA SZCCT0431]|uniref:hypothetical protein n=1 Tax=Bradyrhizobium sp. AUGA SZCCT0431 TaxID=2807674 RepID=UPI001BA52930|nr:hypothetical protein [Bradyrhizobium sp. AUGA SZCCT0431]MBR1148406.1 hypothetical protein [Bradyrhizobium sp. AUGA SZCCT0431]